MDWHENAKIRHELYAVVEGVPQISQGIRLFQALRSSSPSAGPSRGKSPTSTNRSSRGISRSPSPPAEMSERRSDSPSISLIHHMNHLPQTPSYQDITIESAEQDWLEGTFNVKRNIRVVWNPNPTGGVNSLDEKVRGQSHDLGEYEVHFKAPIVSPFFAALTCSGQYVASYTLEYTFHTSLPQLRYSTSG
jgi:hypothetical protein